MTGDTNTGKYAAHSNLEVISRTRRTRSPWQMAAEPADASVIADAWQRMEHLEWHALMLQQRQQLLLVQHQMLLNAAAALHDSMQEQDHGCNGGNAVTATPSTLQLQRPCLVNVVCACHAWNPVLPSHQAE